MNFTSAKDKAILFIGSFLTWYQDSYSLSDVTNRIKLEELVKVAEDIHTQRVKEIYQTNFLELAGNYHNEVSLNLNDSPTKTLKKQLKRFIQTKSGSVRRRKKNVRTK